MSATYLSWRLSVEMLIHELLFFMKWRQPLQELSSCWEYFKHYAWRFIIHVKLWQILCTLAKCKSTWCAILHSYLSEIDICTIDDICYIKNLANNMNNFRMLAVNKIHLHETNWIWTANINFLLGDSISWHLYISLFYFITYILICPV